VGILLGPLLGVVVGKPLARGEGLAVGKKLGVALGKALGNIVGFFEGSGLGAVVGGPGQIDESLPIPTNIMSAESFPPTRVSQTVINKLERPL
jgi:hypothetical protein